MRCRPGCMIVGVGCPGYVRRTKHVKRLQSKSSASGWCCWSVWSSCCSPFCDSVRRQLSGRSRIRCAACSATCQGLQSDSNAVHDAVEQLRREVEALRMPAVQSHGNEEPQSPVCVAVAPSAPGSSSSPNSSLGSADATPQSSPKGKRGRRAGQAVRRRQAAQSLLEILDGIAAPAKGARHSKR